MDAMGEETTTGGTVADPRSGAHAVLWPITLLTIAIELVTVVLRFGFALDATRDTASTIGRLTLGLRIHHSYYGALMVLIAWGLSQHAPRWSRLLYIIGGALFFSDIIHHFAVLWAITGTPQFHLFYPT